MKSVNIEEKGEILNRVDNSLFNLGFNVREKSLVGEKNKLFHINNKLKKR